MKSSVSVKWRYIGIAVSVLLFGVALFALHHILAEVHLSDILARFRATPPIAILAALACTAGGYVTLTGYDVIALRAIGKPLPYGTVATASFVSYTFSHNIGLSLLTGGSIRYRIYSAVGLSAPEIATVTGLCALTFGMGVALLFGLALILEPAIISTTDGLSEQLNQVIGSAVLAFVIGYIVWIGCRRQPIKLKNWSLPAPGLSTTMLQFILGAVDIGFAAGALYLLLPTGTDISFAAFVGVFVAAMTVGVLSHSPGGLGVFEAVMLLGLPDVEQSALLGALLVYRCIYYLLPLALAAALLATHEVRLRRTSFEPAIRAIRGFSHAVAPPLVGTIVLVVGAILLFSAATPALQERMNDLRHFVPLAVIELSHFLSSVAGFWLMILARGLFRRLDGAFHLAVWLLCVGILLSLLKGFDYEEALVHVGVLIFLLACRPAFYRQAALLDQNYSAAWIATIVAIIAGSIWLGLFAYKHVGYTNELWWEFAYRGDAPRFLRASVAVATVGVGFLLYMLLRPAAPLGIRTSSDLGVIRRIVANDPRTDANLALAGDKLFLQTDDQTAFIMYQIQGRSWVAFGEPVGPEPAWDGLLWQFREMCDRHGGSPVFYQVGEEHLPKFLDLGLSLLKLGENARVDLATFSLAGSEKKELRYADRRAAKEGAEFEVIPAARIPDIIQQLRDVSDAWLADKAAHEKSFSVGAFSEAYMQQFDCAVVRRNGVIVAFANIWYAPAGSEISVDIMRHSKDAPYGVMDYLFIQLMLWGKAKGYRWFDLGMAPLSGLEEHPLGPVWQRIGAFMFRHGEHFYNFEGLRAYKEKFAPLWSSRYLAAPGGFGLPRTLLDIAALISGGVKDLVVRK